MIRIQQNNRRTILAKRHVVGDRNAAGERQLPVTLVEICSAVTFGKAVHPSLRSTLHVRD